MKRLWMTVAIGVCALGLGAQDVHPAKDKRTLRPQQVSEQPATQEARMALVIGNAGYKDAPLKNPVNDARAVAEALKKSGFNVTRLEDATRAQMREAIRAFGARIAEGGVGLFYFAGHGMQVKGRNYLVPVGADIAQEDEVAGEAVEVDAILAKMETARNRLNILILDACRNNPFGRSFRSTQQGLAQVDAPTGTFVAFATAPGRTAADGSGAHGLYTEALLRQFHTPGLKLEEVFKRTRADVLRASGQQQTPWENSSIVGDFYFDQADGPAAAALPGPLPTPPRPNQALLAHELRRDGRFIAYDDGTVLDTSTELMWAARDNGSDIDWTRAKTYCESSRTGGYSGWRLPTQDELAGLYDASKAQPVACKSGANLGVATDLIHISCFYVWGSDPHAFLLFGSAIGAFNFRTGSHGGDKIWLRQSQVLTCRALPVRRATAVQP